ncbi:hypothetical protein LXL04_005761 [Taraxacum kok-saghyz]
MENLIKSRDAQIAQMQQAMRAAGLLSDDVGGMEGFHEDEAHKEQKVNYAVRMFEGEALEWWDSVDQTLREATRKAMTWETFNKKVKERYCSAGAMHRVEQEFLALQKGSMTIPKYNTTFNEKLQFARVYCPTEEKLVSHYVEGLPY